MRPVGAVVAWDRSGDGVLGAGAAVGVHPVQILVLVGRRDVDADLEAVPTHRVGERAQDVALPRAPSARRDCVVAVAGRVEHEAVVVLHGEDRELEAAVAQGPGPLVGVESGRLEDVGILVPGAPFEAGEGVHAEVQEGGAFECLPGYLPFRGPDLGGLADQLRPGVVGADRNPVPRFPGGGGRSRGGGGGEGERRTARRYERGCCRDEETSGDFHWGRTPRGSEGDGDRVSRRSTARRQGAVGLAGTGRAVRRRSRSLPSG